MAGLMMSGVLSAQPKVGLLVQLGKGSCPQKLFPDNGGQEKVFCWLGGYREAEFMLQRYGGYLQKKSLRRGFFMTAAQGGKDGGAVISVIEEEEEEAEEEPAVVRVSNAKSPGGAKGPVVEIFGHEADWPKFAEAVSGEWDGVGADIAPTGEAQELPERAVPEAFREWEVQVWDWQTQCPTLADPKNVGVISFKDIRLLPTVGCEADAATRDSLVDRQVGGQPEPDTSEALAFRPDGAYFAATWRSDANVAQLRVEHCLVHTLLPQGTRIRTRVAQTLGLPLSNEGRLTEGEGHKEISEEGLLTVVNERWDGPFRNGDVYGGCGTSASPSFAGGPRLDLPLLAAEKDSWRMEDFRSFLMEGEADRPVRDPLPRKDVQLEDVLIGAVGLPGKHWKRVRVLPKRKWEGEDEGEVEVKGVDFEMDVGWVADSDTVLVSSANFRWSGGRLRLQAVTMVTHKRDIQA